jgi:hypothetical protein
MLVFEGFLYQGIASAMPADVLNELPLQGLHWFPRKQRLKPQLHCIIFRHA